jgi:hypothetical protein
MTINIDPKIIPAGFYVRWRAASQANVTPADRNKILKFLRQGKTSDMVAMALKYQVIGLTTVLEQDGQDLPVEQVQQLLIALLAEEMRIESGGLSEQEIMDHLIGRNINIAPAPEGATETIVRPNIYKYMN